jgi:RHS repeat-associated protein
MNRIQSSTFKEKAATWTSPTNAALAETGYQYDLNGNITALQRNDRRASGWMDNLVYNYTGSGNRLRSVKDNGDANAGFIDGNPSTTVDDYAYDANGNMVTDKNKSLTAANAIQYNHLNLPSKVTKSTGEYIQYTYDATGRKLKQEVFNASNVITKTTDYLGEYIYENNVLQFVNHEEGRIVTTGASPEYQYHLKDHLGNARLTFTSKVEVVSETSTLEDASLTTEQSQFLRYANAKRVNATILDKTNGASIGYAERLNGSTNEKYGLAKSISVMPGDVINIEVYAKYIDPNSANWTGTLSTLMSQIAANTTGVVYDGISYSNSTSSFNASYPGLLGTKTDNGAPKAYLNWLIFDRNYVSLTGGFKQITTAGKETGADVAHELVNSPTINITNAGYVYIWLSNENATPVEVYFDDFKVTQTKSPVVATNDYYAFGFQSVSNSRENSLEQKYLYNGKELQDELNLGWLDYGARMYQPELGRFSTIDPHSDSYFGWTPFNYVADNPILLIDPDGRDWIVNKNEKDGKTNYDITFQAAVVNNSESVTMEDIVNLAVNMANQIDDTFTIDEGGVTTSVTVEMRVSKDGKVKDNEHLINITDDLPSDVAGYAKIGGREIKINSRQVWAINGDGENSDKTTVSHETGHTGGLVHPDEISWLNMWTWGDRDQVIEEGTDNDNVMYSGPYRQYTLEQDLNNGGKGYKINGNQAEIIYQNRDNKPKKKN